MRVMYFAWIRERVGRPFDDIEIDAKTVSELVAHLKRREDRYALAFSDLTAVRVAVDQKLTEFDADITQASEVAFFPPMTGG